MPDSSATSTDAPSWRTIRAGEWAVGSSRLSSVSFQRSLQPSAERVSGGRDDGVGTAETFGGVWRSIVRQEMKSGGEQESPGLRLGATDEVGSVDHIHETPTSFIFSVAGFGFCPYRTGVVRAVPDTSRSGARDHRCGADSRAPMGNSEPEVAVRAGQLMCDR